MLSASCSITLDVRTPQINKHMYKVNSEIESLLHVTSLLSIFVFVIFNYICLELSGFNPKHNRNF